MTSKNSSAGMKKKQSPLQIFAGLFISDILPLALSRILIGIIMEIMLIFAPDKPLKILTFFAWLLIPALFLPVRKIKSWQFYAAIVLAPVLSLLLWVKLWSAPGTGAAIWMIFAAASAVIHGLKAKKFGWELLEFGVAVLESAVAVFFIWRAFTGTQPDLNLLFGFGLISTSLFAAARLMYNH